ncbi:integral membrane protein-like protein [Lineolata rhizophorae]|uniref:Integral membrane protein-like protein n=1 Tax=Lineolata rhizophorae TaxID=578093 RepID=A0A6A6P9G3_9PEZI|nr:integral membrane protein-like protein [Lineolata rhizophorae]
MKPLAIFPILCTIAALVLAFLCLFAGHKKNFMEGYHIITINTSRFGNDIVEDALDLISKRADLATRLDNPFDDITDEISDDVDDLQDDLEDGLNDAANDAVDQAAEELGIEDWYSYHVMDYCWGSYVPTDTANETVSQSDIHKNVSDCSPRTAMFTFDPKEELEEQIYEATGENVDLDDFGWPDELDDGIRALRETMKAMFVLYCVAIGLIFFSFVFSLEGLFAHGRLSAVANVAIAFLAFLFIGVASAIATAISVKGSDVINEQGNVVNIEAHRGNKFLAITWVSTALMFLALVTWCVDFCLSHAKRRKGASGRYEKHPEMSEDRPSYQT